MRILVTGASGFIGSALVQALRREGHDVVEAARRPPASGEGASLAVDFATVPSVTWWSAQLGGMDVVVNAVGILRESGAQTFDALHTRSPVNLFEACVAAGVKFVVQVSALGADRDAQSRYHLSKRAADDALRALPLRAAIVQPSLVYGPGGASAQLFDLLAVLPFVLLPQGGQMPVQPVHQDDLVDGVVALVRDPPTGTPTIAFVGPEAMPLREYLQRLRAALRMPGRLRVGRMPDALFDRLARIAGALPGSFLDRETARMLLRGNAAAADDFARLIGRAPRDVARFVSSSQARAHRTQALVAAGAPLVRVSLAVLWLWTGVVSLGLYPLGDSLALLARVGLHGAIAKTALYGAALLDLAIGVLTLALPARRRPMLWIAQLAVMAGYTVLISVFLPEYWLHPYGPISKNVPIAAAVAWLWALDASRS